MWLAGGVFLQPHPPHSSEVAAPLDDAACEIQSQMLDVVEGQGSWRGREHVVIGNVFANNYYQFVTN